MNTKVNKKENQNTNTVNEGFFIRILKNLTNPKRRIYKELKKELSRAKIDLYKLKQDTISTHIAKIIFEIYKLTYPLRNYFQLDKEKKRFTPSFEESYILSFHDEKSLELYKKISSEDEIKKTILQMGMDIKKATSYFEKIITEYLDNFDKEKITEINRSFSNLLYFARFVYYDFYILLREFDPNFEDAQFLKKPSFSPADGPLLRNDIYSLQQSLINFDEGKLLDIGMERAAKIKGFTPLDEKHYSRLKDLISTIKKNEYLVLILKAIDKKLTSPIFQTPAIIDIFSTFVFKIRGLVFSTLSRFKKKIIEDSIKDLISKIYDGDVVGRIKNYSELKNNQLEALGVSKFKYVEALNYLKAFITDKYKPVISKLINELIVEGIFVNKGLLNLLSNSYYYLNNLLNIIEEFDDDLDVEGNTGKTINRLIGNLKKDKNAKFVLERTIEDVNKRALLIISESLVNIKDLAKSIKIIIEDYKKNRPEVVSNIKKIRNVSNTQFIKELIDAYTTIYYFLKLMGFFVSLKVTKGDVEKLKRSIITKQK